MQDKGNGVFALRHVGKSVGAPFYRHDECFASETFKPVLVGSATEEYAPPFPVGSIYNIYMSRAGYGVIAIGFQQALGKHGVAAPTGVRAEYAVGAVHDFGVCPTGTSFGANHVIFPVYLIDMWAFVAVEPFFRSDPRFAERHVFTENVAGRGIEPRDAYRTEIAPLGFSLGVFFMHDIGFPVIVEEK